MSDLADSLGDLLDTLTRTQSGGSGGSTGGRTGGGRTGGGSRDPGCAIVNISFAHVAEEGRIAYLVYYEPSANSADGYGVLTVPTRLTYRDRVLCNSARSCLRRLIREAEYKNLRQYPSSSSAHAAVRNACPNPIHVSSY